MVDLSKIKPGDEVTLRLTISSVNSNGIWAAGEAWHPAEALNLRGIPEQIVSHTPKALAVGDRVKVSGSWLGAILAVQGDFAWVDEGDLGPVTRRLTELERADD